MIEFFDYSDEELHGFFRLHMYVNKQNSKVTQTELFEFLSNMLGSPVWQDRLKKRIENRVTAYNDSIINSLRVRFDNDCQLLSFRDTFLKHFSAEVAVIDLREDSMTEIMLWLADIVFAVYVKGVKLLSEMPVKSTLFDYKDHPILSKDDQRRSERIDIPVVDGGKKIKLPKSINQLIHEKGLNDLSHNRAFVFVNLFEFIMKSTVLNIDDVKSIKGNGDATVNRILEHVYLLPGLAVYYLAKQCSDKGGFQPAMNKYASWYNRKGDPSSYYSVMVGIEKPPEKFADIPKQDELADSVLKTLLNNIEGVNEFFIKIRGKSLTEKPETEMPKVLDVIECWYKRVVKNNGLSANYTVSGHLNSGGHDHLVDSIKVDTFINAENKAHYQAKLRDVKSRFKEMISSLFRDSDGQVNRGANFEDEHGNCIHVKAGERKIINELVQFYAINAINQIYND